MRETIARRLKSRPAHGQRKEPTRIRARSLAIVAVSFTTVLLAPEAWSHLSPTPPSLKKIAVPPVPGLTDGDNPIVVNKKFGIMLGKAFFWDTNVGSDGMACAGCHFHAGADNRTRNQFSPGKAHLPATQTDPNAFDPSDSRGTNLSNYQLHSDDFPLYLNFNPAKSNTYNSVTSSGTFSGDFVRIRVRGSGDDICTPFTGANLDQTFNVGGIHTRRVEPRNTPTIINAAFLDRSFWDGRANHIFNGVNDLGPRDPNAFVWEVDSQGAPQKVQLALQNATIASLATGPLVNEFEMSCRGRTLQDIARKLLNRRALEKQAVHPLDSAMGGRHRDPSGKGLKYKYAALIRRAFADRYWSAGRNGEFGKPTYSPRAFSQMEANFPLFFGVAVQLYIETLVADDSKFDNAEIVEDTSTSFKDNKGLMTAQELEGLALFNELHCILCHTGPTFTTATNRTTYYKDGTTQTRTVTVRDRNYEFAPIFLDMGFANNGSSPDANDPGIANVDSLGNPLSFASQYISVLSGTSTSFLDQFAPPQSCFFGKPFTDDFAAGQLRDDPYGLDGCPTGSAINAKVPTVPAAAAAPTSKMGGVVPAFKIAQLYNVELTGPYFHNGGAATLHQVVDQYLREHPDGNGGNFTNQGSQLVMLPNEQLEQSKRDAIVAFLKTLTDPRVRNESAPFDHPELPIYDGHIGTDASVVEDPKRPGLAKDHELTLPAVGRRGRKAQGLAPLTTFEEELATK
jgi:cytochrome c peroxidase